VLLNRLPLSHVQETEPQSSQCFYVCREDRQESHPLVSQVRLVVVSVMSVLVQHGLVGQVDPHRSNNCTADEYEGLLSQVDVKFTANI